MDRNAAHWAIGPCLIASMLAGCSVSHELAARDAGAADRAVDGGPVERVRRCTTEALAAALAAAEPGETVNIGDCRIPDVAVTVPAGVELAGDGSAVLTALPGAPAVRVVGASSGCTRVRGLTVEAHGAPAIVSERGGAVCIEDVGVVAAAAGSGLVAHGLSRLSVRRFRYEGPVTREGLEERPADPPIDDMALIGVAAECVGELELADLDVQGFDPFGVLVGRSRGSMVEVAVAGGLGTGVLVAEADMRAEGVRVTEVYQGVRLVPAYAWVANEASVDARGLRLSSSEGYGALFQGGVATVTDALIESSASGGVWVQRGELSITGSRIMDSGFSGLTAVAAARLLVEDVVISGTRELTRIVGTTPLSIGVGVYTRHAPGPITLRRVMLEANATGAADIALTEPPTTPLVFEGVTLSPADSRFTVRGTMLPHGWNAGVEPMESAVFGPVRDGELDGPSDLTPIPPASPDCP